MVKNNEDTMKEQTRYLVTWLEILAMWTMIVMVLVGCDNPVEDVPITPPDTVVVQVPDDFPTGTFEHYYGESLFVMELTETGYEVGSVVGTIQDGKHEYKLLKDNTCSGYEAEYHFIPRDYGFDLNIHQEQCNRGIYIMGEWKYSTAGKISSDWN